MAFPIIELDVTKLSSINELEFRVQNLVVDTNEDIEMALNFGKSLKDLKKQLEDERTQKVKPFNDHVKDVNSKYKPIIEQADNLCKIIEQKCNGYRLKLKKIEEERIRNEREELIRLAEIERQKKLEEAVVLSQKNDAVSAYNADKKLDEAAKIESISTAIQTTEIIAKPKINTAGASLSTRKTWEFEIIDKNQIPREFLIVDEAKIRKCVAAGIREIKGVKIYQKETSYIR